MEKAVNPKRTPSAYSLLSKRTGKKVTPSAGTHAFDLSKHVRLHNITSNVPDRHN